MAPLQSMRAYAIQQWAKEGLTLQQAAERAGMSYKSMVRYAKEHGIIFERAPRRRK